jgi:hypothetical protein
MDTAKNPNLPAALLSALAQDELSVVRGGVARNQNAPAELLGRLSSDECKYVRYYVADNSSTSADTLDSLADDGWHSIRTAVAGNFSASANTLEKLFLHIGAISDSIRRDLQAGSGFVDPEVCAEARENFVLALARNPNTPLRILAILNRDPSPILGKALRNCIAQNPAWKA